MPVWLQITIGVAVGVAIIALIVALVMRAEGKRSRETKSKRYRGYAEEPGGSVVNSVPQDGHSGDLGGGHSP